MIGCLTVGSKKTLANYLVLNVMSAFVCSFLRIHGYLTREIYHGEVRPQALTQFPAIKGSFISGDISLNPGPLTRSQSAKSKDVSDRLCPTLHGERSSSKGLKIGHWNINGLLGKIHEVRVLLLTLKFDVLAITESHLGCRTKDADNLYSWLQNR